MREGSSERVKRKGGRESGEDILRDSHSSTSLSHSLSSFLYSSPPSSQFIIPPLPIYLPTSLFYLTCHCLILYLFYPQSLCVKCQFLLSTITTQHITHCKT